MYKNGSIVNHIVSSVKRDDKLIAKFKHTLEKYENKDIAYGTMEDLFYHIIRKEDGDKLQFVRSDIGRAWGILESWIATTPDTKPKQFGQESNDTEGGVRSVVHVIVNRVLENHEYMAHVFQLMIDYEGRTYQPSIEELEMVFYEVLNKKGNEVQGYFDYDLRKAWELVQVKILNGNSRVLPQPTVRTKTIEEKKMSATTTKEKYNNTAHITVEYIYGVDIASMDKHEIMAAIVKVKEEIKDLKDVDVKSTFIDEEVAKLEKVIKRLVKQLDSE